MIVKFRGLKERTKTSMLCTKSVTCPGKLPEYSLYEIHKTKTQTMAKPAGLCTPFKQTSNYIATILQGAPKNVVSFVVCVAAVEELYLHFSRFLDSCIV